MPDLPREALKQLFGIFSAEAEEHIEHITRNLLDLEKGATGDERSQLIEDIFREAHSLKGSAGSLGFHDIERIAHAAEDLFGACKNESVELTAAIVDTILSALDFLKTLIERAGAETATPEAEVDAVVAAINLPLSRASAPEPKKPASEPAAIPAAPAADDSSQASAEPERIEPVVVSSRMAERTIRVSMQKLDAFMHQAEEILLAKIRVDQRLAEVRSLGETMAALLRDRDRSRESLQRVAVQQLAQATGKQAQAQARQSTDQLKHISARVSLISRNLVNDSQQMQLLTQTLQDDLKGLRLTPVGSIFEPLHRLVRDLAKRLGKKVFFEVSGSDIEIDKRIIEEIKDPILHLIRNSLDHGVEMPDVRVREGKGEAGTIWLRAEQRGNRLMIDVKDDGRGIDPRVLRARVVQKGIMRAAEADALNDDEARRLVFMAGFSTSEAVTDISGRGVGLDVVKQNLGKLGGLVELHSELGHGSTFALSVPLTLASAQGLLVGVGSDVFAISINSVERIVRIPPSEVATVRGKATLRIDGRLMPLVSLAEVLELSHRGLQPDAHGMFSVVVVGAVEKRVAFVVDELIEEQDIVSKPIGKPLSRVRNVAGATILGDGRVVVLLNSNDLVRTAFGETIRAPVVHEAEEHATILVADDTMTTRTLQKQLLEMAGYHVLTAKDGEEAYTVLQNEAVQVLVSDVQMPRLDGFDLTARIRGDAKLKNLPVILVTSLGSEADKARGIEVGADAYIVKKEYEKGKILEVIRQLL
jgi:two-component system chemotaxis sensor kinase CheA